MSFLIRVNSFPLKRETHLALDSRLKHVAYISRSQESFVSCQNFCFFSNSPKNLFLKKFLEKGVASLASTRIFFYSCQLRLLGGKPILPPHLTPQIQCLPDRSPGWRGAETWGFREFLFIFGNLVKVNVLSNLGEKEWNLLRIKQNVGTNILKRSFLNQAVFIKVYHMNS